MRPKSGLALRLSLAIPLALALTGGWPARRASLVRPRPPSYPLDMMAPRQRWWTGWLAALLALVLPATRVAALAAPGQAAVVDCCCGEHSAEQPCGCPDCPGAVESSGEAPTVDSGAVFPCGRGAEMVPPITVTWFPPPDGIALRPPPAGPRSPPADEPLPRSRVVAPESPPPDAARGR